MGKALLFPFNTVEPLFLSAIPLFFLSPAAPLFPFQRFLHLTSSWAPHAAVRPPRPSQAIRHTLAIDPRTVGALVFETSGIPSGAWHRSCRREFDEITRPHKGGVAGWNGLQLECQVLHQKPRRREYCDPFIQLGTYGADLLVKTQDAKE